MTLINRPTQVHLKLPDFFKVLRDGTAPEKFTQQHLKDIGFGGSNYRILIPLLKDLNFLSSEGVPTDRYREYLDASKSASILGEAVYEGYRDLFTIVKNPTKADKDKIAGKFKSTFNVSDLQAERSANTFLALVELSDFDQPSDSAAPAEVQAEEPQKVSPIEKQTAAQFGLKYDISIQLPATKDIEVYNAIFKSLKEHLID